MTVLVIVQKKLQLQLRLQLQSQSEVIKLPMLAFKPYIGSPPN